MTVTPRLAPLGSADWTPEQRAMLRGKLPAADRYLSDDADAPPLPNILGLFGHHPQLAAQWLGWNADLLEIAELTPRHRELVILRVAWRTQCHYEWAQHVLMARDAGMADDEIAALAGDDGRWVGIERDLLHAADQMVGAFGVDTPTWERLAAHFDDRQLLELLFLVGSYCCLAQVLNSVHLPPDPGPDGRPPVLPALQDGP